jgi:DoxX-like family
MHIAIAPAATTKGALWTGRVLSTLAVLFLVMDAGFKFIHPPPPAVAQATAQLGLPQELAFGIGVLLLVCTILYALPWTAFLGAVLLTGYLGGAVALQLRVGNPLFSHVLFPVYAGALVWAGLVLREPRLRAVLPLRR